MWMFRGRSMQYRYVGWGLAAVVLMAVFFCLHLLAEVSRLDSARIKLEKQVVQLQQDNIDASRRHLSFAGPEQDSGEGSQDDSIIIYNRVPKTGSTSFAGIVYDLCKGNRFHVVHINMTRNVKTLALSDQMRFITNITTWSEKKPAFYHGHLAFIDFYKFGIQKTPIYINMVRDPVERMVSYYYFLRYGDDFRPYMKRRKAGNHETFDECVARDREDCDPENLWLQIPFFCGHVAECWNPGSQWALEQAKQNVLSHYLLVGVTEELGDFIAVLEATLPRFFKGATQLFNNGRKSHLRKTLKKYPPEQATIDKLHRSNIWKMENEFYEFVLEHFHYVKQQTFDIVDGEYLEKGHRFQYEKIRPSRSLPQQPAPALKKHWWKDDALDHRQQQQQQQEEEAEEEEEEERRRGRGGEGERRPGSDALRDPANSVFSPNNNINDINDNFNSINDINGHSRKSVRWQAKLRGP